MKISRFGMNVSYLSSGRVLKISIDIFGRFFQCLIWILLACGRDQSMNLCRCDPGRNLRSLLKTIWILLYPAGWPCLSPAGARQIGSSRCRPWNRWFGCTPSPRPWIALSTLLSFHDSSCRTHQVHWVFWYWKVWVFSRWRPHWSISSTSDQSYTRCDGV